MQLVLALLIGLAPLAAAQGKRAHRGHAAHEHGAAAINIVIEGTTGIVEFEAPAEGVFGFEHAARTAAQKKQVEAALATVRTKGGEMVQFDAGRGCRWEAKSVEVVREAGEEHAEVKAEYTVACAQAPGGSRLRFGVSRMFPRIERVQVQVLNGAQQAGLGVRGDRGTIVLTR
ncbi:MAG: DUF2796 domain-containing protein [Acidobacteria bacterium]|nr:DUF2796 domain-containing protein [Acidobacteriota bacterium]